MKINARRFLTLLDLRTRGAIGAVLGLALVLAACTTGGRSGY